MEDSTSHQQYDFLETAVAKAQQDADAFLLQTLKANKDMYGYPDVPAAELLRRVKKGMAPNFDNYYEYWLDGGTTNEVFVAAELIDFITLDNGKLSIGQVLSELPLRPQRAMFDDELSL